MKFFYSLIILVFMSLSAIAQENEPTDSEKRLDEFTNQKRHEVSVDVLAILSIPAFQPRYEYILGRYSGIGADVFIAFNNDDVDYEELEKFSITPFYRQYFFSKEDFGAKGFYGEGFIKAYTYETEEFHVSDSFDPTFNETTETYFETAIGVSVGWKWVSNSGFMIDLSFGIGRNLGFADDPDSFAVIPRGGLHFGWRF